MILFSMHESLSNDTKINKWDINFFLVLSCSAAQYLSTWLIFRKNFLKQFFHLYIYMYWEVPVV